MLHNRRCVLIQMWIGLGFILGMCSYVSAQSFVDHNKEMINQIDKDGKKVSRWKFYGNIEQYIFDNRRGRQTNGNRGSVVVRFTIDTNGYVKKVRVDNTNNYKLNNEAKCLVKSMPRWQPGFV